MLELTICTKNGVLRKQLETAVTQLMNASKLDFHLSEVTNCQDISDHSILILGDSDSLADYHKRKMMIVVLNDHRHDRQLAGEGLIDFVEPDELGQQLTASLMKWLDYYFDNYHYSINEAEDFLLMDVLYFVIQDHRHIKVVLADRQIDVALERDYALFVNQLPLNFLLVGTEYIINMDLVTAWQEDTAIMPDGKVINGIDQRKRDTRLARFNLQPFCDFAIGDKYEVSHINKALRGGILTAGFFGFLIGSVASRAALGVLAPLIGLLAAVILFVPQYLAMLGSSGNYYELRQDGIAYFDAVSMRNRFKWSMAIKKGDESSLLSFIPYEDVAYIRLGVRETANAVGAAFLYFDQKNYDLKFNIETTTSSLHFESGIQMKNGAGLFSQMKHYEEVTRLVNLLRLMGIKIEGNDQLVSVLNDPNATLQQFMTRQNQPTAF